MLRVKLAAMLLKSAGHDVEFVVRRKKLNRSGKGTTVLVWNKLKGATQKADAMRLPASDKVTVSLEAVIDTRRAKATATGSQA